jgi:hypothetical protein
LKQLGSAVQRESVSSGNSFAKLLQQDTSMCSLLFVIIAKNATTATLPCDTTHDDCSTNANSKQQKTACKLLQ